MEKLLYRKKIGTQLILTDEEREDIANRVIEFMRSCLSISNYIHEPESQYQTRFKDYSFGFAGYTFGSWNYFRVYEKEGIFGELSDETLLDRFMEYGGMFDRFKYFIRMNASKPHIEKLIELLGSKVALTYFDYWAKKNMAVAIILKEVVNKLQEETQPVEVQKR